MKRIKRKQRKMWKEMRWSKGNMSTLKKQKKFNNYKLRKR
jgi:hypothetical protein